MFVRGRPARIRSMAESLHRHRIGYVSENRKEEGLILGATVTTNLTITVWNRLARPSCAFSVPGGRSTRPSQTIERLDIKTPSPLQTVMNLSGGNQQKVSIGKWLIADCDILIVDEPTVGVDVGAKEYIHDLIWRMAKDEGKSIILISSDLPELDGALTPGARVQGLQDRGRAGGLERSRVLRGRDQYAYRPLPRVGKGTCKRPGSAFRAQSLTGSPQRHRST